MTTIPLLDRRVDHLEASVRLTNILDQTAQHLPDWAKQRGLPPPGTLRQLLCWSLTDVSVLKNMGKSTKNELVTLLDAQGLRLRDANAPLRPVCTICGKEALENLSLCLRHADEQVSTRRTHERDPRGSDSTVADMRSLEHVLNILRVLPPDRQQKVLDAARGLLGL